MTLFTCASLNRLIKKKHNIKFPCLENIFKIFPYYALKSNFYLYTTGSQGLFFRCLICVCNGTVAAAPPQEDASESNSDVLKILRSSCCCWSVTGKWQFDDGAQHSTPKTKEQTVSSPLGKSSSRSTIESS